jgi:hypothetical protein
VFSTFKKMIVSLLPARSTVSPAGPSLENAKSTGPRTQDRGAFWKSSISARFRPGVQELIIYFCVSRSASRAQRIQQGVLEQPESKQTECKAEVLRLVGWEFDRPHITVEIKAKTSTSWDCCQINENGLREPFGYIVLSTVYALGLVNSFTIHRNDLLRRAVRFQLTENSGCTRLN